MSGILIILAEMVAIAALILIFYNLKSRFGFAPLFILIGVNQFFQSTIATSFFIKFPFGYIVSPGSVILFSASLFVVLLIYIKEGTRITQHFIVGIVLANFAYSLLNWITQQQGVILSDQIAFQRSGSGLLDVKYRVFFTGTILMLLDAFVIVILYEFFLVRIRWMNLYTRLLITMLVVLNLDAVLFILLGFKHGPDLWVRLTGQLISKSISAVFFASVLWVYLRYLDKSQNISEEDSKKGNEDIFSILTYKGKFEKLQTEKAISDEILQKAVAEKTNELEGAISRFTTLTSASELRMDIFSPEEKTREFLVKLKDAFKVDACTIHVIKNEELELLASVGLEKDNLENILSIAKPFLAKIIKEKRSRFVNEAMEKVQSNAGDKNNTATFSYKSLASAPLIIGEKVTGILNLFSIHEKRAFSTMEMEQLQIFAIQEAQSIDNHHMFQEIEKHKEVLVKQIIARKKAEDTISKSEANLRILFNQTAVLIWDEDFSETKVFIDSLKKNGVKDLDAHFRNNPADLEKCASLIKVNSINEKSKEFYNVKTEDELIQNIPAWFTPDSWVTFRHEIVAFGNGANYFEGEIPVVTPEGEIKHLYIYATVPTGYFDTWEKVIVSFVDVTDRKKAEFENEKSKDQFQKLIENISGVYWVTDRDAYKTLYVSDSYETITGRRCEDLYKDPADFLQCIHPDDKAFMNEQHKDSANTTISSYSMRIVKPSGEVRWLLVKKNVVVDGAGKMIEYGYAEDITEKKKSEEEKQLLLQRNKQTIETMIDGFILADDAGKIIDVNPAYCKMAEFTREELLQKNINELEASLTNEQIKERIAEMVQKKSVKFETKHFTKNLKILDMSVSISIMEFEGKPLVAAFLRDITEQKKAEEKIIVQKEELQHLASHLQSIREEERTNISREIHDELGQQLTIVKMNIHTLFKKNKDINPQINEQVEALGESINATIDTVRKIASELRPVILDEQGLIDALKWQISEFSKHAGVDGSITIETDDLPNDVNINTQVFRIFQETLTNIARHAKATKVRSVIKNENGYFKLLITDDGVGFDQNENGRKKSLGLIMMRERATSIGATLHVISQPNQGTSVLLSLPINK